MSGRTALHYAVDLENIDLIDILLEHGANPDAEDENGASPMDEAEYNEGLKNILKI